jgi:DNA-binding MarR family transcriptional regulator
VVNVCAKTCAGAKIALTLVFARMQTTPHITAEQLTDELARFLMSTMKTAQAGVFEVVAELDLSMTQLKILHILDGSDQELTPSELAQIVGLSPAATGRAVDALVRGGVVSRRDDEADRRVKRLALTDAGAAAVSRIARARLDGLAKVVDTLDPAQRDALSAALAPLLPHSPIPDSCAAPRTEDPA